ncbi:iron ABC transporter permease [Marinospirillum sp.]|uniref:FecCD family ABC transporter permease n=1 Tax=Marinospirillum sp. TaxID=2183934 RepID=UPI00286FB61D|nr:iron ABC transporter permease [Marinospirillum sp.]MDR9467288.1 iron ABC transporter permease [Marinospirillum sp.]
MSHQGYRLLYWLLPLAALALLTGLLVGSVQISPGEAWAVLNGQGDPLHQTLLLELRLPRVLAAFAVGGLLAIAGALMQLLLRNPLADPYVLGLSGGAATGALLALLSGAGAIWVSGSAFIGALVSTLLVFGLARLSGNWNPLRLLLTGVVLASGWGAMISFMLAVSPSRELPGMLYWLMGDLAYAQGFALPWFTLLLVLLILQPLGRSLNVLSRGSLQAASLGMAVPRVEGLIYLLAALMTAVAVTVAGSIGFVGLLVPHALRLLFGYDQRLLLPACALAGGSLLVLADTLARTLLAPQQLPVGVITALIGVPAFLWLLSRRAT